MKNKLFRQIAEGCAFREDFGDPFEGEEFCQAADVSCKQYVCPMVHWFSALTANAEVKIGFQGEGEE